MMIDYSLVNFFQFTITYNRLIEDGMIQKGPGKIKDKIRIIILEKNKNANIINILSFQ